MESEVRKLMPAAQAWAPFRSEATDKWRQCAVHNSRGESPWGRLAPACLDAALGLPGAHLRWAALSWLDPLGIIPRHNDGPERPLTLYYHVPVITNDESLMIEWDEDGNRREAQPDRYGIMRLEYWRDHMAVNGGATPRVHLLVMKIDSDDPAYLASVRV